jgi:hypothetical protein
MEDNGKVSYRFGRNSICFVLSIDTLNEILPRHQALAKKFRQFKVKTMSEIKPYPLDYIMNLPKHLIDKKVSPEVLARAQRLENSCKNVVIRRITEIRALKAKPSLKDMISMYMKKKGEKDERARIRIKEQVL